MLSTLSVNRDITVAVGSEGLHVGLEGGSQKYFVIDSSPYGRSLSTAGVTELVIPQGTSPKGVKYVLDTLSDNLIGVASDRLVKIGFHIQLEGNMHRIAPTSRNKDDQDTLTRLIDGDNVRADTRKIDRSETLKIFLPKLENNFNDRVASGMALGFAGIGTIAGFLTGWLGGGSGLAVAAPLATGMVIGGIGGALAGFCLYSSIYLTVIAMHFAISLFNALRFLVNQNGYLMKSGNERVQLLARYTSDPELLSIMADNRSVGVREEVALNSSTPQEVLKKLSEDKETFVRRNVARNPNTPADTQAKLLIEITKK